MRYIEVDNLFIAQEISRSLWLISVPNPKPNNTTRFYIDYIKHHSENRYVLCFPPESQDYLVIHQNYDIETYLSYVPLEEVETIRNKFDEIRLSNQRLEPLNHLIPDIWKQNIYTESDLYDMGWYGYDEEE